MIRMQTQLEAKERWRDEAARLREALFIINGIDDLAEIKRIAMAAMSGELHGHELPPPKIPELLKSPI